MKHYARLANIGLPSNELNAKIDDLLAQLGLTDQQGTIVGDLFLKGLSGGQKRRLSIALEALSSPDNFLLDEPTSGLDAESALQVMEFLRRYARGAAARRVVLTIHQPSTFIWERIDNVVLLSKGMVVYEGARSNMEEFFVSCGHPTPPLWNCADHYVTMVNDEFRDHAKSVKEWVELYSKWEQRHALGGVNNDSMVAFHGRGKAARSKSMMGAANLARNQAKRASSLRASFELTYRYFLNLWFNPGILFTRVAMYSMLAFMVGGLFWKLGDRNDYESILSRSAVSFYCVAFFIFMSVAVLPFTVMERDIVDKEVQNGYYHPIAYQVAQGLASIPAAGLLAGLVSMIIILMLEFQDPEWYFLNMFLALSCSEALAQLVSHVVPHFVIGMALVAGLFGFFMLFQGFMIIPSRFPDGLKWTYYIAFHSYSWRSFMVTEFTDLTFDEDSPFATGEDVLKFYEIDDVDRAYDMIVLACYAIILHLCSFVVLHIRHKFVKGKIVVIKK
jgi:ABC-type multidrug transport system ATPase subunit